MVDIEINARFSLFLISRLTQSCVCILKSVNINNQSDLSEAGKLKIETTETGEKSSLILKNWFLICLYFWCHINSTNVLDWTSVIV